MTLEKLPACLAVLLLSACRTIDAPAKGGDSEGDGDSSGTTGDASETEGPGTSSSATSTPVTTAATDATTDATTDDGNGTDETSGVDPDDTGTDPTATSDGSSGPDTGSDSTGAVEPMPCGSTCVALPGGEWQGPVALSIDDAGDPAPGCSEAWGTAVDELFSGLVAPPAQCECSCGDAEDVTCSPTLTLNRKANNGASCAVAAVLDSYQLSPGCNLIEHPADPDDVLSDTRWDLVVPGPEGGSCDPIGDSMIAPPSFTTRYTMCGESSPAAGECNGGQTCVADTEAPLCVWTEGDVECPGDGFGVKHLVFSPEVEDTRSCTACTCGEPEGTCVTSGVDLYDFDNNCMPQMFNAPVDMPAVGCVISEFHVFDASYPNSAIPTPQTSCEPGVSNATGDVDVQGPVTVCCNG
jgi:hypothetical protein